MTAEGVHERRAARERAARKQAEALLEQKSLELYLANQDLTRARDELELRVAERTRELQQVNSELRSAKEAAEAASQAKTTFLANMSHEIRTPMTAILGYADLALDPTETSERRFEAAEIIKRNGEHLLEILDDILDLSKLEAGRVSIERIPVDPVEILEDVVDLMRVRAAAKALNLTMEPRSRLPRAVLTDPTRLRQILVNIVGNAIKFTEVGSVTLIGEFLAPSGAGRLRIHVVDTGVGIPSERLESIFATFGQADTTTTRCYGGTGLGLTLSRRLARLLGGEIEVSSQVGLGSRFSVEIDAPMVREHGFHRPHPAAETAALPPRPAHDHDLRGLKVLFAEDGPDNQRLISHLLRRRGAVVEIVDNGRDAVARVLDAPPPGYDVLLLDMQMPIMDGYQAAATLRAGGHTGPILALTANVLPVDRTRCLAAGCDDYASKPIDVDDLCSKLARLTGRAKPGT